MTKIKDFIKKYIPIPAMIAYCLAIIALAIHITAINSKAFADWYLSNIGSGVRTGLAYLSNYIPFSIAETTVILIPLIIFSLMFFGLRIINRDSDKGTRFVAMLLAVICIFYSVFIFGFGTGYYATDLEEKLGLEKVEVDANSLFHTTETVLEKIESIVDEIDYTISTGSKSPLSYDEMIKYLNDSYAKICEQYPFITNMRTNVKRIALSEPLTYTHIAGIYSYYTGEANINTNTLDYTLPFTAAHEMSHQRGISREEEANFMGFLVCVNSDNVYIQYSGYMQVFEYLLDALYNTDSNLYTQVIKSMDQRVKSEEIAFNNFFEKYRSNLANDISSTVNDVYLKAQGQAEGIESYNLVVNMAVSYFAKDRT